MQSNSTLVCGVALEDVDNAEELQVRFWASVPSKPEDPDACWEWVRAKEEDGGYGLVRLKISGKRRMMGAHRLSLLFKEKVLKPGTLACHTCDNPSCVRWSHLFPGGYVDNAQDCLQKGRHTFKYYRQCGRKDKLNAAIVVTMRRRAEKGETYSALAREYGVNVSTASAAVQGITWKSAPYPPIRPGTVTNS